MSLNNSVIHENLKSRICEYFEEYHIDDIDRIVNNSMEESLTIDYENLKEYDQTVANDLADSPDQWFTNAQAALEEIRDKDEIGEPRILIENYSKYNPSIRNLRDRHLGKIVRLDGTVSKSTGVLHKAEVAAFECRKCGSITRVKQPLDSDLEYPTVCKGEDCQNRTERDFKINPTQSKTINFRKVEIQEPPEETSGGETPETETFTVKGDIADNVKTGNNVTGIGIYRASDQGDTSIFRTYVKGINIIPEEKEFEELEITEEDKEKIEELSKRDDIYDTLKDSVAPSLYGLEKEKEAVMYQLFRGVRKTELDGTNVRGDIHVLMCGDPGTGKSQLLRYASKLSPRGVMTSGKGVSEAGLCVGPETNVMINGDMKKIGDFVDKYLEEQVSSPTAVEVDDLYTVGFDYDLGVTKSKITYIWRMPKQKGVEIKLDNGYELVISKNTPLVIDCKNGDLKWQDVKNIDIGDYVSVSESTPLNSNESIQNDWARIESINEVETEMYDMTTDLGNFYANGIVTHNTAAAVKDAEFGGNDKWTLKAGALVLADQGIACVDEIDKMKSSDRSAMHEGLEQQTISISKAGINSTLKSRCTLLAAANPKDGRWNEFDPVPTQIDLEPPLVSRFDMIFAPEDERTEERDTKLSSHILDTNLRGQQLEAGIDPENKTSDVEPEISPELFKKYVAYSRQNCTPVMNEEAYEYLQDFFVSIRAEGEQEGAIPVTARKIEGLVRISEAVARIQLSDTVEKKHAERAKNIVMESLKDVGYDEEAGRFDVDMTETNQSQTQRDRRNVLKNVIKENRDEGDKGAPEDVIFEIMKEEHDYEEDQIQYDLKKMASMGDLYEPKTGEYDLLD